MARQKLVDPNGELVRVGRLMGHVSAHDAPDFPVCGTDSFIRNAPDLMVAVNAAVTLDGLLVKGEPGTAIVLAVKRSRARLAKPIIRWHIKSAAKAQHGPYRNTTRWLGCVTAAAIAGAPALRTTLPAVSWWEAFGGGPARRRCSMTKSTRPGPSFPNDLC